MSGNRNPGGYDPACTACRVDGFEMFCVHCRNARLEALGGKVVHRACGAHKKACSLHAIQLREPARELEPPAMDEFARGVNGEESRQSKRAASPSHVIAETKNGPMEGKTVRLPPALWATLRERARRNRRSDVRELEVILAERLAQAAVEDK